MALPVDNYQPSLALTQFLPLSGIFPSQGGGGATQGIPLGSIRTFAGNFAFGGSALAEGQLLPINQNTALFSLLGFMYGGNGTSMFALPDLDGRTLIGGPPLPPPDPTRPAVGSGGITLSNAQLPSTLGGSSQPIDNYQPSLPITYLIRTAGIFPTEGGGTGGVDFMGQIVTFAGNFVPDGFLEAAGQTLQIVDYIDLFNLIGTTYGGDGQTTFALPDLRDRTIVGTSFNLWPLGATGGQAQATLSNANLPVSLGGSGQVIDNHQPSLALTYLIALQGIFPSSQSGGVHETEQYLGEIVPFAGDFAPKGWAKAEGQLLSINQHQALFSLLGTMYGGNGQTTFALPDLRDRTAIGTGDAADVGDILGSNDATVLSANIPDVHVTGTSDPNTLYGGDGHDSLDGAGGADTMIGNLGNDTYFVDNAGDVVTENPGAGNDTVRTGLASYALPTNVENLTGTSATGQALNGNALDNVITGGTGADAMSGGTGNDAYLVDNASDAVTEIAGQGNDTVYASINYRLTANVDNLVMQGSADLQGYGNNLTNALYGNGGNNFLDGDAGADTMIGLGGNDAYVVDNAADTVTENPGEGNDTVYASISYTLTANVDNLILQGNANLQGYGNALVNALFGNGGNNLLDGNAGADSMFGGTGDDSYIVDNAGDQAIENAGEGTDTVFSSLGRVMGANIENLNLTGAGNANVTGNNLANAIAGNSADNTLDGGVGADTLYAGAGNDAYVVDNAGDQVIENAGEGNDTVFASIDYRLTANVDNLVMQGSAGLQGYGNSLANGLFGNTGSNLLDGDLGADTMVGGAGNDAYLVDNAGDQPMENASEGNDTVFASIDYRLTANVDNLVMQGSAGLQGYGNSLTNGLFGNTGSNLLDGDLGADAMYGGAGNDVYFVDNAGDQAIENAGEGNDTVYAAAHFRLSANVDNLILQGSTDLQGYGNSTTNAVFGNSGVNLLDGGAGADVLTGDAGNDVFMFNVGQGAGDTIVDFAGNGAAMGDSLYFAGYGPGATFTSIDATHWQVNYNGGVSHDIITFMNGAPIHASDYVFM